jgi:Tfp pilus assembly protein PilF
MGNLLLAERRWREGVEHLRTALELDPNLADAHFLLAAVLSAQGKTDEATAHYADAVRLKPELAGRAPGGRRN